MANKEKQRKIFLVIIAICLFIVGNRIGMIVEQYHDKGMNDISAIMRGLLDLTKSFSAEYYGMTISFRLIPLCFSLLTIVCAVLGTLWVSSNRKNYKIGEEHGSARYGKIESEAKSLVDTKKDENNMILSENIKVTMDTRQTFLNDNVLVIGGSGSGKTRYHVKPNVLQLNCNYIITDPKGSLLTEIGNAFKENGYDIKVLNLVNMDQSMRYNPFNYIHKPNDVFKFINNLVENTSKQNSSSGGDDFFVKAEIAFLTGLVYYIMAYADDEERNMNTLMDLIDLAEASEEDENSKSVLDIMFDLITERNRVLRKEKRLNKYSYSFLAERQYKLYKKAAGKTAKSILISVGVRMGIFNIPEVGNLLSKDELDLKTIAVPKKDKNGELIKTALFVIISDSDTTFSFIAGIVYQQLYDLLYMTADARIGNRLPIHTRFIQDEFANVGKQRDFEIKIATMRSREISVVILVQNLTQLKNLYKDSWETIFGNCDTTVFLGGKEPSTLSYMSKLIGNTTIDYMNITENKGQNGGWSKSNQLIQRPLLAPDEIGRLKPEECLIHIRGHHIYRDWKYNLKNHVNIELTTDAADKKTANKNIFKMNFTEDEDEVITYPEQSGTLQVGDNILKFDADIEIAE